MHGHMNVKLNPQFCILYPELNFGPPIDDWDKTKMQLYEVLESEFIFSSPNT